MYMYMYFAIPKFKWLASNGRPSPIVLFTNEQVKGRWLATPSTSSRLAPVG